MNHLGNNSLESIPPASVPLETIDPEALAAPSHLFPKLEAAQSDEGVPETEVDIHDPTVRGRDAVREGQAMAALTLKALLGSNKKVEQFRDNQKTGHFARLRNVRSRRV